MSRQGGGGQHGRQDFEGPDDAGQRALVPTGTGAEAFVTFAQGRLKVFNSAKNFGFISPIFRGEDAEGPPLKLVSDEGLWFFGNHSLPSKTQPGVALTFEVWENSEGKPQARGVELAPTGQETVDVATKEASGAAKRHPHEPRVIYPSVYISDVPVEYTEETLRELHKGVGLNPDTIMGLKFLPFTEVSLGSAGAEAKQIAPVTGSVILRYCNEEAANAACERLKGHPIKTSTGVVKYLGARHAAPAKWMMERKVANDEDKRHGTKQGEALGQKVTGTVARVSAAGYGVIKSKDWGEVMWRQYELPTNLRSMQVSDPQKFQQEVQSRADYRRLKEMEGREVEAELYRLPDGQLRAWHVRPMDPEPLEAGGPPARGSQALPRPPAPQRLPQTGSEAIKDECIVCVHPVPLQWSDAELRERFEWYGGLVEVEVQRRVNDASVRRGRIQPPKDGLPAWSLGVLRFEDAASAAEVVRTENGGYLEKNGRPVAAEAGLPRRAVGWCEGVVMRYFGRFGVGTMRSAQVDGEVHFEAPMDARHSGLDMQGMRVDAKVEYGADGCPQAREVQLKIDPASLMGGQRLEDGNPRKKGRGRQSMDAGGMPMPPGGMQPWGMANPGWGANDPWFKTQPCPYHRQGMCQMGQSCYFAHSPEELRAAPEAMMMNQFARMMGGAVPQVPKKKKDKKLKSEIKKTEYAQPLAREDLEDKKEKRFKKKEAVRSDAPRDSAEESRSPPRGPPPRGGSRGRHLALRSRSPRRSGRPDRPGPGPPRKRRIELDDADF